MARSNDEKRRNDDEVEQNPIRYAACEVCGDEYDADELVPCETCSWLMCEACEADEGNCNECARELGLRAEDE